MFFLRFLRFLCFFTLFVLFYAFCSFYAICSFFVFCSFCAFYTFTLFVVFVLFTLFYAFYAFLCLWNLLVKKKKKFKTALIPSFAILLTCAPLNLPMENLFVRTYFYLWSSVRISSFYENLLNLFLFFICAHLFSSSFYHSKSILIYMHSSWSVRIENLREHK